MTIEIRPLCPIDLDVADGILQRAFKRPANRRIELERGLLLQPDGWYLALSDGTPGGMVGSIVYDTFSWIGLMAVDPGFQSRGIGRALMTHLLANLERRGSKMVLLDASDEGFPLYRSLGFVEEDEARIYEAPVRKPTAEREDRLAALTPDRVPAVAEFDAPIFGARRDAVIHTFFREFPGRAFVANDAAGRVEGYLVAQARRIGPWAASTPAVAETLLHRALRLDFPAAPQVIVPGRNAAAVPLLQAFGFTPLHANRHMRRGGTALTGSRNLMYGQASFAIG